MIAFCNHGMRKCVPSSLVSGKTPESLSKMTALLPPDNGQHEALQVVRGDAAYL